MHECWLFMMPCSHAGKAKSSRPNFINAKPRPEIAVLEGFWNGKRLLISGRFGSTWLFNVKPFDDTTGLNMIFPRVHAIDQLHSSQHSRMGRVLLFGCTALLGQ
jgi:hypothetical protein